jgi:hypothetical protein
VNRQALESFEVPGPRLGPARILKLAAERPSPNGRHQRTVTGQQSTVDRLSDPVGEAGQQPQGVALVDGGSSSIVQGGIPVESAGQRLHLVRGDLRPVGASRCQSVPLSTRSGPAAAGNVGVAWGEAGMAVS